MGFKCGIVGLPNVGKSTLFNALTSAGIAAANYPFCTIEPNVGVVAVPDERLAELAEIVVPERILPTTMEFVDIAGLVAGASRGEGLGNKFLGHVRETDAIAHVVRCFVDDDVVHVSGEVDPLRDIDIINTELALADLETAEKALIRAQKAGRAGDKALLARSQFIEQVRDHLAAGEALRTMSLDSEQKSDLDEYHFVTIKPVMYVANVAEDGFVDNPLLKQVETLAQQEGSQLVAVCGAVESELAELEADERVEFLAELGLQESGLERVIRCGYTLLNLLTFFTAGKKEVRAWTVSIGATAPNAAGRIHTDFEKGFIRAEVIAYSDFVGCGGEQKSREAGKQRLEGKEYLVNEGDVMHFRFNV